MKQNKRLTKEGYAARNAQIFHYAGIHGAKAAAEEYALSEGAVFGIIANMKKYDTAYHGGEPPKAVAPEPAKPTVSIFEDARDLIYGDREKDYGDPLTNLNTIANYWEGYLHSRGLLNPERAGGLAYFDVCRMMELLKIARLGNSPFARDSSVDVCGYEGLIDRIRSE